MERMTISSMNHREIEDRDIAFLYLKAKLPAEERRRFEEHLVDCSECLDRIELLQGLRSGLKQVASDDVATVHVMPAMGFIGWLSRLNARQQAACAGGIVAAMALAIALPLLRMRGELTEAKRTATSWQARYRSEQEASAKLRANLTANEAFAGAAIFALVTSRSAEGPPINKIVVSTSVPWIVFSLDNATQPGFQSYRATLKDSKGSTVWQAEELVPVRDTLAVVVPSRLIINGNYLLTVEGLKTEAPATAINHYSFEVTVKK